MGDAVELVSERITVSDSLEEVNDYYYERGWTDGLPIIPPTEDRVAKMLSGTTEKPGDVLGEMPPRWGAVAIEKIAVNAVMAGCLPEYMPVLIAAVEAMLEPEFNLYGVQATTNPSAPLIIVNGPIRGKLGINSGYNVLGQGTRANATIGRALRLILVNIGGAVPGTVDKATQGQPGKYSFCIAENEERNPWEPLHVERGFEPSVSTVTVHGATSLTNVNDHNSIDAKGLFTTISSAMTSQGCNNILLQRGEVLILLSPEHADTITKSGLSKQGVKEEIFQRTRVPFTSFNEAQQRERFPDFGEEDIIPAVTTKENVMVVVAGGTGKHSKIIPTFGDTLSVTKPISL